MSDTGGNPAGGRRILFIVGFPRSGTKLLRKLLNRHEQIFVTQELMFVPWLLERWPGYGDVARRENFARLYADVMRAHYFAVRAVQGMETLSEEEWYTRCATFDPAGVLLPIMRREAKAPEHPGLWLGDKSPNYTTRLALIKREIPEAKIIHIVRDVRDAALSARKAWGKNMYRFAQRWSDGLRVLWRDFGGLPASDVLELRYEDLLERPAETLARVTAFLGVEFDEKMLTLDLPSENLGAAAGAREILPGNVRKYQSRMSERERRRIESVCASELRHYGYECRIDAPSRRLSRLALGWYALLDVINRFLFDLKLGRGLRFVAKSTLAKARMRL
ncbi:MAG: sulfotransferase [Gammaproteobacteria bacterium]|nr:sulfotransferase [Gammaproteobacteria bacterium]